MNETHILQAGQIGGPIHKTAENVLMQGPVDHLKFARATWFWLLVARLGSKKFKVSLKICVNVPMLVTRTCTQATWLYAMVAQPVHLSKNS